MVMEISWQEKREKEEQNTLRRFRCTRKSTQLFIFQQSRNLFTGISHVVKNSSLL